MVTFSKVLFSSLVLAISASAFADVTLPPLDCNTWSNKIDKITISGKKPSRKSSGVSEIEIPENLPGKAWVEVDGKGAYATVSKQERIGRHQNTIFYIFEMKSGEMISLTRADASKEWALTGTYTDEDGDKTDLTCTRNRDGGLER